LYIYLSEARHEDADNSDKIWVAKVSANAYS